MAALAFAPAAANAAVTTSNITKPAGPVFGAYDNTAPAVPAQTFDVAGTTNGTTGDTVDVRCFYTYDQDRRWYDVASGVAVDADGTFTAQPNLDTVGQYGTHSCVLRAVPAGGNPAFLPDFAGPSMHVGRLNDKPAVGQNSWSLEQTQPKGRMHWRPTSNCGLTSRPYFGGTAYASFSWETRPWDCAAALYESDGFDSSEIVIDGHHGYDPYQQQNYGAATGRVDWATWSSTLDSTNGNVTIVESGEIKRCVDGATPTPNAVDGNYPGDGCAAFVPTGITRERTIVQDHEGQVGTVTDKWISNDNAAHKVQLGYDNASNSYNGPGGEPDCHEVPWFPGFECTSAQTNDPTAYKLPGESAYAVHGSADTVEGLAAAPATINVRVSDRNNDKSYGALTYTTAPDGLVWRDNDEFVAHYTRDIAAGGTLTLTHVYSQAPSESEIGVLGASAEDQQAGPTVTITSPANGSTVKTATPTVTGTATDNVGVKTLTVNGQSVTPGADGAYSTKVKLKPGSNTITAIATDAQGNTAQAQTVVIYKPATAKKCKVPKVAKKKLAAARSAIKKAGCVVGKVRSKATHKVKPGHVISQSRKAGTRVAVGTRVNLTVARPASKRRQHVSPTFTG